MTEIIDVGHCKIDPAVPRVCVWKLHNYGKISGKKLETTWEECTEND